MQRWLCIYYVSASWKGWWMKLQIDGGQRHILSSGWFGPTASIACLMGRNFVRRGTQASQAGFVALCSTRDKPQSQWTCSMCFSSLAVNSPFSVQTLNPLPLLLIACLLCASILANCLWRTCARALEPTSTRISQISKTTVFNVLRCWSLREPS